MLTASENPIILQILPKISSFFIIFYKKKYIVNIKICNVQCYILFN